MLTDKGKNYTDRFRATGERQAKDRYVLDQQCREHGIERRLTPPQQAQTKGMVKWYSGRIAGLMSIIPLRRYTDLKEVFRRDAHRHPDSPAIAGGSCSHRGTHAMAREQPGLFSRNVETISEVATRLQCYLEVTRLRPRLGHLLPFGNTTCRS